jgi:hypothetical protein
LSYLPSAHLLALLRFAPSTAWALGDGWTVGVALFFFMLTIRRKRINRLKFCLWVAEGVGMLHSSWLLIRGINRG